jgi:hypothetical protein
MPVYLQPHELEPGMRLARPVVHERKVLLGEGRVLSDLDIEILRRDYAKVTVYILDPVLDDAVTFQDEARDRKVAATARRKLLSTMTSAREKFASRMSLRGLDLRGVHEAMAYITHYLNEHPDAAAMIMRPGKEGCYLTDHPANVFYLSLVVGNAVRNSLRRGSAQSRALMNLAPLGLAALFMDVALWPLEEVFEHPGPLSKSERELVLRHPIVSAEAMPGDLPSIVPETIRQHHENYDGTGYPESLPGEASSLFARILRVADAFDAATSTRTFREAKSPPRALWEMTMGPYSQLYDPSVLKIFGTVVQPFPIGAKLRMSCGRYAVVVRFGERYSLLPEIIIAFDQDGKRLARNQLEGPYKLDERLDLRVVSYNGEDLSDMYTDGTWYDEILIPHTASFETLFESVYP